MTDSPPSNNRLLWLYFFICVLVAVGIWIPYTSTSTDIGNGDLLMPLDDVYIHFQYARQLANGEPYVYNPGDAASSGATSFIYPYLLAIGYKTGFTELNLGYWAMGIGALALTASTWMITVFAYEMGRHRYLAPVAGILFAITGSISWHFMSGMETGLIITFALATFITLMTGRFRLFIIAATLLALTRPEGSMMAGIAAVLIGLHLGWTNRTAHVAQQSKRQLRLLVIPIVAILLQPIVNLSLTGSMNAMGAQAKSILGTIPFYWEDVIERIWHNFVRIWRELATGTTSDYTPVFIAPLALVGFLSLFKHQAGDDKNTLSRPLIGFIVLGWFIVVSGAVSTLDTAFWHFKRYQMPLIALLYPLAVMGGIALWTFMKRRAKARHVVPLRNTIIVVSIVAILVTIIPAWAEFHRLYEVNINNIAAQPLPMARWLKENTPEDAVVAVHDVGMMRYIGERTTIDMVGLTTPGAADAWRNGPGAVAEFLMANNQFPYYIAAYTTARGLNYLVDASLYGELLAGFPAQYAPEDNVALAADFQGIYRVNPQFFRDISDFRDANGCVFQYYIRPFMTFDPVNLYDKLNVADLVDERAHHYQWSNIHQSVGFVTEVYQHTYTDNCRESVPIIDGGRLINGQEIFTLHTPANQDAILVTRVHATGGTIDIYANDVFIATRWLPVMPGYWFDVPLLIPAEHIPTDALAIKIIANTGDGYYMPYYHWLWSGEYLSPDIAMLIPNTAPLTTYQDGAFAIRAAISLDENLTVDLAYTTDGSAEGDYKVFVHLYDNIDEPPIAQQDRYPGNGTLPPGNWLPGTISDTIMLDTIGIPPGTYQVAIGFYNPYTFERLMPTAVADSVWVDENSRRLFIGEIEITEP